MHRIGQILRLISHIFLSVIALSLLSVQAWAQSLIRDTEIENSLWEFSTPIIKAAGLNPNAVDIYIVNDSSLNAFVTRGQNIFIHTGLILESKTPNQLKGVIAHEVGHIAGGHLVRSDYGKQSAYGAMLVAAGLGLAAILAGETQAGAYILGGATQFGQIEWLAYSRTNESAADQYAAQYLEQTQQSGKGLIQFFEKFRYQEVLSNARRYPYFRGHPLSSDRIDALREIVEESSFTDVTDPTEDTEKLDMMKAKLLGFLGAPQIVFSEYPLEDRSAEAHYARAVAYFRMASLQSAIKEVETLIDMEPDNPYYYELKGQILYESGKGRDAIAPLERAVELDNQAPLLEIALAQALIETDEKENLNRSIDLLKSALQKERGNSFAWFQMSQAYGRLDQEALASYATAEQAFHLGDLARALSFANRALEDLPKNIPQWRRTNDIIVISEAQMAQKSYKKRRKRPFHSLTHN